MRMIKNLLVGNICLLLVYFISGQITQNLLITPSGATPLWIPAGIALGAVLIWGYRLLPAIFLGDFLIAQSLLGLNDDIAIILCAAFGLQALMHAGLARYLLVSLKVWPTSLMHDRDIIYFFLVAAIITPFLSSALMIGVELYYGVLTFDSWLNSFIIWWLGNALGVILFTPIVLILFATPRTDWSVRKTNVALPLFVLFLMLLLILNFSNSREQKQISEVFNSHVNMAHGLVEGEIMLHRTLLKSMRAYFQNSIYVTPEEFQGYLRDYSVPGFDDDYVVGWIERVDDVDRVNFESQYGFPVVNFDWTARQFKKTLQRKEYYVSKYIHSTDNFAAKSLNQLEQIKGVDICFDKQRAPLCQYMLETRLAVIVSILYTEIASNPSESFWALMPVFSTANKMTGIVAHAYEYKKFFQLLLQSATKQWIELDIIDITNTDTPFKLFSTEVENEYQGLLKGDPLQVVKVIDFNDRLWQFTYKPSLYFTEQHTSSLLYWMIIGTFFILSVISTFLLSLTGRAQIVRQEVKEKTREISEKALLLEKSEAKYRHLVEGVQDDYLLYSRDIKGNLTYVSPSVEAMLGYKPEEFLSHFSDYVANNELNRLAEEFTNQSLLGKSAPPFELEIVDKQGCLHTLRLTKSINIDQQGQIIGVEGIAQDITQLKASRIQLEKLSLAVTHSPNAVLIIDINGTVEYVNPKFTEITGYAMQEIKDKWPGELSSENTSEELYRDLWDTLLSGGEWRGEIQNQKKNGDLYWAREHISPMIDAQGKITHFVVMEEDVTESRRLLKETAYQASHDLLTGLINRREFECRLTRIIHSVKQDKTEHALCFLDLDQFKIVNDTCGHVGGDELLRQVSSLMQVNIRSRDTLARLGGDEFVILMEHCRIDQARNAAQKIIHVLENFRFQWDGGTFKIGVSIGIIQINENTRDRHSVLRQVDSACYAAKDAGRNRIEVYNENSARLQQRIGEIKWSSEISNALDNDRFSLYVQAIESIVNPDQELMYEVLVRMQMSDGSMVAPSTFLPAAERYNSATRIDRWVVETTIQWLSKHTDQLHSIHSFAINLSGQSLGDEMMLRYIVHQFESTDVPGEKIKFEITETAAVENLKEAAIFMQTLSKFGCRFSLDDFGSGLSSFAYLKNLQFDVLKIDGMFVKDMLDEPISFEMVKSINQIGHVMGLETIAEFVENQQILEKLREIGVDYAQGYHIGKPVPIESLLGNQARRKA